MEMKRQKVMMKKKNVMMMMVAMAMMMAMTKLVESGEIGTSFERERVECMMRW